VNRTVAAASLSLVAAAVGCGQTELPSPNPPPSWGVPISGGTMLVTRDGGHAVIADPDRDRILAYDLASDTVTAEVALSAGDEPGRLVEDAAGRIHVALRRGGAVVTLADAATAQIAARRAVCAEPRGLAYDAAIDAIHVACAGGELVTLPAAGGDATRTLHLDRDLRDVIVDGNQLIVTRFRTAELLALDATGAVVSRSVPPTVHRLPQTGGDGVPGVGVGSGSGSGSGSAGLVDAVPEVAWRTISLGGGRILVSHQRQLATTLAVSSGGYSQGCGQGPVEAAITLVPPGGPPQAIQPFARGALPIDVAVNPSGDTIAIAFAGAKAIQLAAVTALSTLDDDQCNGQTAQQTFNDDLGAPTSIAFTPTNDLLVFYPELPALVIHGTASRTILLPGEFGYDSGRALFHTQTSSGLACASCHPEGRDDGRVWQFADVGKRRTQSLAGHIVDRAPYHWGGDMADLPALMQNVFGMRMAGGLVTRSQTLSLGPWLDRVPPPAPIAPADPTAVGRGLALFESPALGCTTCHLGALMSNSKLADVGTGGTFKVPSLLGVAARPPYMHDGCAATLRDRFGTTCGGGDTHGHTSQLTEPQLADLIAYLESI
jgi:hypothetical protein